MKSTGDFQISVIVPVFNAEKQLRACLDALLAQTFGSYELILVNNASRDRSPDICREYQARRPDRVTVLDEPDQGVSYARNRGLDAASGQWIAFCDADDQPEPEWLARLHANAIRENADLSCCAFRDISPDGEQIRTNFPLPEHRLLMDGAEEVRRRFLLPLLAGAPHVHGYLFASLFRRDRIKQGMVRFTPGVSMKEDELFYMDYLCLTERIIAEAVPLYRYIRGEESATALHRHSSDLRREKNWCCYTDARLQIFRKHGLARLFPDQERELAFRMYTHRVQAICCDPGETFRQKMKKLRAAAQCARQDRPATRCISGRIFLLALFHCRVLLPLLCALKRRRDRQQRSRP